MREASMDDITKFLACKRVAFVGVSRNSQHFSRALLREFVAKGYAPVPVNPRAAEIEGRKCFARLCEITPPVEAALLMTGAAKVTDLALQECNEAAVRNIWIYKRGDDREHEQTVEFCRARGSTVVEGYCPFMFLPHPVMIHRIHRFFIKLAGSYPS